MHRFLHIVLAPLLAVVIAAPVPARAEPMRATPQDRAAIEACLALVRENVETEARNPVGSETPGPAGRLAEAAKAAATARESCIGAVNAICQQAPGGYSTAGMVECITREWAAWDERLNRVYNEALKDAEPKLAKALREAQRAWLQWREKTCALPGIDNEGGSIVGPLAAACMMDATARQALWLEQRE